MSPSTTPRIRSLDGLRGLAALVVVFDHVLLVNADLASPLLDPPRYPAFGTAAWWATETPAHLLWAGSEAVFVFFVLSGLVLTLPHLRHRRITEVDWVQYYPRRIVRLYVPVVAAILLAVPLMLAFGQAVIHGASWWRPPDHFDLGLGSVLEESTLLGDPGHVITALWSLKWEVVFSLLLPLFLLGARPARRHHFAAVVALLVAMLAGTAAGWAWLVYLPIFGLGVVLATRAEAIEERCRRIRPWQWAVLSVVSVACLLNKWLIAGVPGLTGVSSRGHFPQYSVIPASVGALLAVVIAWQWVPFARWLDSGPVHWLGERSYSLYLVHVPLVVVVADRFGGWNGWSVPIVVVASLVAAHLFHRFVELPSIRWSRSVGRWATTRLRPSGATA